MLAGLVERVTYHNAENGFCVLRAKARGHRDVVTVVGHAAAIAAGEWITASGEWVNDRTHGQQFKARFLRTSPPTSADGIEKYLSSGMIRGVGPVYAKFLPDKRTSFLPRSSLLQLILCGDAVYQTAIKHGPRVAQDALECGFDQPRQSLRTHFLSATVPPTTMSFWRQNTYMILPFQQPPLKK